MVYGTSDRVITIKRKASQGEPYPWMMIPILSICLNFIGTQERNHPGPNPVVPFRGRAVKHMPDNRTSKCCKATRT